MTLGVMLPLVVGEFDVSVGYMLGALVMAGAFVAGLGAGTITVVLVMVGGGGLVGLLNGLLTVRARISSFIGTLGVGIILEGVTQGISNGEVLYEGIPKSIMAIGAGYVGGLAIAVWAAIAIAVMLFYVLEYTPLGRRWYAIGGSGEGRISGGLAYGATQDFGLRVVRHPGQGLQGFSLWGKAAPPTRALARHCCYRRTRLRS